MASDNRLPSQNGPQVQDRIYFLSIFGSKISELESEIQRLHRETDSFVEDNQQYTALSKTAEDLSQQTQDLRNELEDYNMARMNSFCDVTELQKEIDDLHAHNQQVESIIDELYLEKQRKEERIEQLEDELSGEKPNTKKFREKNEISTLESQLNKIREQTSGSIIQQEALSLIDQIFELQSKHDQTLDLTTQIEEDNEELESIEKLNENLEQCLNDIQNIQKTNLTLLTFISRTLITANAPQLEINLDQYEIEKQNSIGTLTILAEQHRKLKQDFIKLETLDQKLIDELRELKIKSIKMQEDIAKFNDLEGLKRQAERRKHQLTADKTNMIKRKQITQIELQTLQSQFENLRTQLQENQIHQQLVNLEQKLQTTSQTLFSLDEIQTQYEPIKHQALALVYAHNQWLIQRLKTTS